MQCPICKSKKVNFLPWVGMTYECVECGYRGPIGLEERKSKLKKLT